MQEGKYVAPRHSFDCSDSSPRITAESRRGRSLTISAGRRSRFVSEKEKTDYSSGTRRNLALALSTMMLRAASFRSFVESRLGAIPG